MENKIISLPIEKYQFSEITNDIGSIEVYVYHNGYNPNGSFFEDCTTENSKDSFKNKPIVGSVDYDEDGNAIDFKGHELDEKPFGVIPETNNYKVVEIDSQKWVVVNGLIFKEYCTDEWRLLKQGKKISMEIEVLEGHMDESDGFYHIDKFNLLCVTVLGDNVAPAMGDHATITIFENVNSDKFISKFTEIIDKVNSMNNGGKDMEREEIIAKFSTLENVEGYSAIVENVELSNEELEKELFSLSCHQIELALDEEVSSKKVSRERYDGRQVEYARYYVADVLFTENIVIVVDTEDYHYYGLKFEMSGDKAVVDFDNAIRYTTGDWRVYEDGTKTVEILPIIKTDLFEGFEKEIEEVKGSFVPTETEEYKAIQTELEETKAKFEELETEKEGLASELEALKQFKAEVVAKERQSAIDEVVAEFSMLKDIDGYDELMKDIDTIDPKELTVKCKVFAFDNKDLIETKKQTFSDNNSKNKVLFEGGVMETHYPTKDQDNVWSILDNKINK